MSAGGQKEKRTLSDDQEYTPGELLDRTDCLFPTANQGIAGATGPFPGDLDKDP